MNRALTAASIAFLVAACAGDTTGARPTDMSVEAHEATAASLDGHGDAHRTEQESGTEDARSRCGPARGDMDARPCWTSTLNPTAEHTRQIDAFRKAAADHRAAAQALRDSESAACTGLSDDDRDTSPFAHREDLTSATELTIASTDGKTKGTVVRGASITLRAVPGLTKEYLQRVVGCHLARNASMGFSMTEMDFCPLGVKGARATVNAVDGGFRVDVEGDGDQAIAEIGRRAKALVGAK